MRGLCGNIFMLLGIFSAVTLANWLFIFSLPIILWLFVRVSAYFLRTSRELKRLDNVSRSPIFQHFSETLNGIVTIRAFGDAERFNLLNQEKVDTNLRPLFFGYVLGQWLDLRLRGYVVCGLMAVACGLAVVFRGDPGLSAMSIQFCLQLSWGLSWMVQSVTQVETQSVSIERVCEFSRLEAEETLTESEARRGLPPSGWPAAGRLEWKDVMLRYRPGLTPALREVSWTINPGEKIGICGRTGAGKSSLTVAMLRLADEMTGSISIDGIDHTSMALSELRGRLALIPQEATMFAGDVRLNLDPLGLSKDSELWHVLSEVELGEAVKAAGGLTASVSEDGANWSQGQRQLMCIARALLKNSKLVMLGKCSLFSASSNVSKEVCCRRGDRELRRADGRDGSARDPTSLSRLHRPHRRAPHPHHRGLRSDPGPVGGEGCRVRRAGDAPADGWLALPGASRGEQHAPDNFQPAHAQS